MPTEILETDIPIESMVRFEMKKRTRRSRRALVCNVSACLATITFFAALFFAIKVGLETGLRLIAPEVKAHVGVNG
jgi:hypothetical protein